MGALVVISHDRYFLDSGGGFASSNWDSGVLRRFDGGYTTTRKRAEPASESCQRSAGSEAKAKR